MGLSSRMASAMRLRVPQHGSSGRDQAAAAAFALQRAPLSAHPGSPSWLVSLPEDEQDSPPAPSSSSTSSSSSNPLLFALQPPPRQPLHLGSAWTPPYRSFAEAGLQLHRRRFASGPSSSPGSKAVSPAAKGATPGKIAPDAADCDTALGDYVDLQQRLANLKRPSTLPTWGERVRDLSTAVWGGTLAFLRFLVSVPSRIAAFRSMSKEEWAATKARWWKVAKEEGHHYWMGTKLLGLDVKIASRLAFKAARGVELSRRERRQLTRTTADIFRLVPMIVILVIPFMELALPIILKVFPNMLPSTYEDKMKKEETIKRSLVAKLEVARFLQDTVAEMADDMSKRGTGRTSAAGSELYAFIKKVRAGEVVENSDILRFSQLFNDELTLDNLERVQLVTMCQFVGISPFGTDQYLRTRLRTHLQQIKADDYAIEQEGLENLTEEELRTASRARGMQGPFGTGAAAYMRRKLHDWLDLSLHRGLPSSLLLLSRAFTITSDTFTPPASDVSAAKDAQYSKIKETLSVLPEDVVEAVEGHGAVAAEAKLELIKREEELIKEEAEVAKVEAAERARQAAAKAKATAATAVAPAKGGDAGVSSTMSPEEASQRVASVLAHAMVPEMLTAEVMWQSEEERAANMTAEQEKKIGAIVQALGDLASRSGLAKERRAFLDLVTKEVQRLNKNISDQAGPGSSLVFTGQGLKVGGGHADEEHAGDKPVPPSMSTSTAVAAASKRLSGWLENIEKELDSAEASIGGRLHVLDLDQDGMVSREELEGALQMLREKLGADDLKLLHDKLGGMLNASIPVAELLALGEAPKPAGSKAAKAGAVPTSGDAAVGAEAAKSQSTSIHTR